MKMSMKAWIIAVAITVLGGANAGIVFSWIESRFLAAMLAGAGFLVVGLFLLRLVWSHPSPRKWCTFYTSHVHLLVVSVPMILMRVLNPSTPFSELKVLGLPGPDFHRYSTFFYQLLILGVVIDAIRFYYDKKKAALLEP